MAEQNGERDFDGLFPDDLPAPMFPWGDDVLEDDPDASGLLQAFTADYVEFTLSLAAYVATRLVQHGLNPGEYPTDLITAAAAMTPDLIDRQRELLENLAEMREGGGRR